MIENIRKKIDSLHPAVKFIIRLIYPIGLYVIFHFGIHTALGMELRMMQFAFLLIWGVIEWQLFLKK